MTHSLWSIKAPIGRTNEDATPIETQEAGINLTPGEPVALPLPCSYRLAYFIPKLMTRFFSESLQFAMHQQNWWVIPLLRIGVVVGLLLFLSCGSGISRALYPP